MSSIRLRILGPLSLLREDGTTSVRSILTQPKRFAVLAYLAAGRPGSETPRDTLLGLFWPELDDRHARKALRQTLYDLRRALGPGVITGKGTALAGVNPDRLPADVQVFSAAIDARRDELALELYRGPLLHGFHLGGAPAFERWMDKERRRLRRQALDAAWRLVEAAETADDPSGARHWGERALELAPYDEDGLRRYLESMDRSSQPAAAIRAYERYVEQLRQDLDLEPTRETVDMVARIRSRHAGRSGGAARRGPDGGEPIMVHERESLPGDRPAGPNRPPPPVSSQGGYQETSWALPRRSFRRIAMVATSVMLAVLAILAATLPDGPAPELASRRVAVLPLENRTGDPALDPVGRIAADWMVQGLAGAGLVDVVPSALVLETLAQVEQSSAGLAPFERGRAVAHRLGTATIVVGSFHQRADELEFQAQIFEAERGRLVEAIGGVHGSLDDPMPAIDELRRRALGAVGFHFDARIEPIMRRAHRPPSYDAYLAFATGLEHRQRYEWQDAVAAFGRAWAMDTTFVPALFMAALDHLNLRELAMADSLLDRLAQSRDRLTTVERLLLQWAEAHMEGDPDRALEAIRGLAGYSEFFRPQIAMDALKANRPAEAIRAYEGLDLETFPELPQLTAARRLTASHHRLEDYAGELDQARRARQRHPDRRAPLIWEARALIGLGQVALAQDRVEEALRRTSRSGWWPSGKLLIRVSDELRAHGHEREGRALLSRAIAWYRALPDSQTARPTHRRNFATALLRADSLEAAEAAFQRLADEFPDDLYYSASLAVISGRRGDVPAARSIAESLGPTAPYQYGHHWYERARIAADIGDRAAAIRALNEAISRGFNLAFVGGSSGPAAVRSPAGMPHLDPAFAALRDHPAFRRLATGSDSAPLTSGSW